MTVRHFNHSGAGLPAPETVQTIVNHLKAEAELGPMEASVVAAREREATYDLAAGLLNCSPDEVIFGTGHGQLFGDIVSSIPLNSGDQIFVSRQEWMGNIACLENAASLSGAKLSVMASDESTAVDVEALREALSADVRMVVLTWIGASGALINPAAAIGRAIRESGSTALYIIDASQALGQIPIDVQKLCCDALIACGRKFLRGPRGTALAYISTRLLQEVLPRQIDNFSACWNDEITTTIRSRKLFEPGEQSVALRLGLGTAMQQALDFGVDHIRDVLDKKSTQLREKLSAIPGVKVLDLGKHKAACVTFTVDGIACSAVKVVLAQQGMPIGMNGRSYTPYDLNIRNIPELLRASVHMSTTEHDIEIFAGAVRELVAAASRRKKEA